MKIKLVLGSIAALVLAATAIPLSVSGSAPDMLSAMHQFALARMPKPPKTAYIFSAYRTAPLTVALVFGRAPGCTDASPELIESTARAAIETGMDPAIGAATEAVESDCNQYAISTRGAVGLMQLQVKTWKDQFDFAGDVNLFNRDANLRAGMTVEAKLIQTYGVVDGVRRYNGTGVDCATCDAGYTSKILALAGRK